MLKPKRRKSQTRILAVLSVISVMLLLAGCGMSSVSRPPDYDKALRGAPDPLAALYSQANELLPGGEPAFAQRLEALRGYPVVVNVWAAWCGECRIELPMFQRVSARLGKRVAFFGIDSFDDRDAAATLLSEAPLPYPSYSDPSQGLAESLGPFGLPATAFFNREGELTFFKRGSYRKDEDLEADIERYSMGNA
ncbi:MAG: TlpA disulfide reductase family protein [Solirubrobacterales bacterium]